MNRLPAPLSGSRTAVRSAKPLRRGLLADSHVRKPNQELLDVVRQVKGKVMLSGYASHLYDQALAGWSRQQWDRPSDAAGGWKKARRVEVLWCNFDQPGT